MGFLQSRLKTSCDWEELAKNFFGHWEDTGFGNLDKSKLEALLIYCLHVQEVVPANGIKVRESLNKQLFIGNIRLILAGETVANLFGPDSGLTES
jgi:hypothetical protein